MVPIPSLFVPKPAPFSPRLLSAPYDRAAPIVQDTFISRRLVLLFMWEPFLGHLLGRPWTSQMLMLPAMSKQFVMMEHILFPETVPVRLSFTKTIIAPQCHVELIF